jgi:hypothetical protein
MKTAPSEVQTNDDHVGPHRRHSRRCPDISDIVSWILVYIILVTDNFCFCVKGVIVRSLVVTMKHYIGNNRERSIDS